MIYTIPLAKAITDRYPYILPVEAAAIADGMGYKNVKVITADQVTDKSSITGAPVFMPLNFSAINYIDDQGGNTNVTGLYMPIAVISFTIAKELKETGIAGSKKRGQVTELINIGWYEMTINGCFISKDRTYPADSVSQFDKYMKANIAIPATHKKFTILGINQLVIRHGALLPKPGFTNMQLFEITAKEDIPLELKISNETQPN